jgi:hypothetical protein
VLLCRVVLPSYRFLNHYNSTNLFTRVRQVHNPDLFARLAQAGEGRGIPVRVNAEGLKAITKIVLHTGKDLASLTTEEVLEYRAKDHGDRGAKGVHEAWELLAAVGLVPDKPVREVLRQGQMSAAEVVDHYRIRSRPVRDLLIRYLNERRPSLDYGSFRTLGSELVGAFWADIERHHAGFDMINLPSDVVETWKQRLRVVTHVDGTTRTRKHTGGFSPACGPSTWTSPSGRCPIRRGHRGRCRARCPRMTPPAVGRSASRSPPRSISASGSDYRTCPFSLTLSNGTWQP